MAVCESGSAADSVNEWGFGVKWLLSRLPSSGAPPSKIGFACSLRPVLSLVFFCCCSHCRAARPPNRRMLVRDKLIGLWRPLRDRLRRKSATTAGRRCRWTSSFGPSSSKRTYRHHRPLTDARLSVVLASICSVCHRHLPRPLRLCPILGRMLSNGSSTVYCRRLITASVGAVIGSTWPDTRTLAVTHLRAIVAFPSHILIETM